MSTSVFLAIALVVVSERPILISAGQSLSIGVSTGSTGAGQVGSNLMCSSGRRGINTLFYDVTSPASVTSAAVSSNVQACNPWPSVCIGSSNEPPVINMQNHYHSLTGRSSYSANSARDGTAYGVHFQPGGRAFDYLNMQLSAFGSNADPGYCAALYIIHGEADHIANTPSATYAGYIEQWRSNIESLCRQVTVQRGRTLVAYVDQVSSYTTATMGSDTTSTVDLGQYLAAKTYPSTVKLIGPKYIAVSGYDACCHGNAGSYRYWGKMAAKAAVSNEMTGVWDPVWPVAYARSGANVVVTYNVPVPPLLLGTGCNGTGTTVTAPADGNYGFSYSTSAISSVALCTGVDTPIAGCFAPTTCTDVNTPVQGCARAGQSVAAVSYVLTTPGTGVARYASVGTAGAAAGQTTGVRGMLCDSDPATADGYSLRNWGVQTGLAALDTVP